MSKNTSKGKILIVDDEIVNVEYLRELLSMQGYEVVTAASGTECLDELNKHTHIDLILLDIMMPEMDGYEVCKIIKSKKNLNHIPIIFLTALDDDASQVKGLTAGAVDYVTKPIKREVLEARVHNHLTLKQANDKIKKLYNDLKETEKVRDALSHMIVHDLRNPLMAIQGIVGLLQMTSDSLSGDMVHKLQQIQGAGDEMANLINAILDMSKMESKTMTIFSSLLNTSDLIKEVAEETKVIYNVSGVSLELKIKNKELKITADKELVKRILKNLLSNSLKFSSREANVEMTLEKSDNNALFRVNDAGPGIPKELREKIFDKFYQIRSKEVKKKTGVGLGLAFCRMAAEAMNCKIWVEDRPDSKQGSSFCLALPLTKK